MKVYYITNPEHKFNVTNPKHIDCLLEYAETVYDTESDTMAVTGIKKKPHISHDNSTYKNYLKLEVKYNYSTIIFGIGNDRILFGNPEQCCYIYFDDGTTAEYHCEYPGIYREGCLYARYMPFDGVFVIDNGRILSKKYVATKERFYANAKVRLWYDIHPMFFFVNETESVNTFLKELAEKNTDIADDAIKGRVSVNYIPNKKKYRIKIQSNTDLGDNLDLVIKEFNINSETMNLEIIIEKVKIKTPD